MSSSEVSRETLIERYFPHKIEEIKAYAQLLTTAGIERGLIGPREGERIWERHIFNCLPIISLIPQKSSLIDIGSGAGLPGIVIALARPDLTISLIEPLERRQDFLEEAIAPLVASGSTIEVLRGQAQDFRDQAHYVTARAVAPLEKLKRISWHLIKVGGSLLAMKGESAQEEMKSVKNSLLHEITLEDLELGRIVEIRKGG